MKKRNFVWLASALLLAGVFSACDNMASTSEAAGFTIKPVVASLELGGERQFKAYMNGEEMDSKMILWVLSGGNGESTLDDGLLKIAKNEVAEILAVTAIEEISGNQIHTEARVMLPDNFKHPEEYGLKISPSTVVVDNGVTQTFTATLSDGGGKATGVVWEVIGKKAATTISNSGVLTVNANETASKLVVIARQGEKWAAAIVYVGATPGGSGPYPENHGLEVTPSEITVDKGSDQKFQAYGAGNITWSLQDGTVSSIDAEGYLMVSADETVEKIVVKATASVDGSTKSGTAVVTVHNGEKQPTVTSVDIQPHSASVFNGGNLTFTAKVTGTGNPSQAVTWSISGGTAAAGTNINANTGVLTVGSGQTPGSKMIVRATSVLDKTKYGTAEVSIIDSNSLKIKFGVTKTEAAGVTETFKDVSDFIRGGGLETNPNRIQLGNYIDMEGGLTVASYQNFGGFTYNATDALKPITTPANAEYNPNYSGVVLRLIVVGINSFNGKNGNNTPHIVFQFQNIPVISQLNITDNTYGGYPASDVRAYLSQVDEAPGNFLAGLNNAGVPQDVLWGPTRMVSNGTDVVSITDKLWLPTEPEILGNYVSPGETKENQARLEYYTSNNSRIKYTSDGPSNDGRGKVYWEASANTVSDGPDHTNMSDYFDSVSDSGGDKTLPAEAHNSQRGLVPAFCVY